MMRREFSSARIAMLQLREIERGLLVESLRLLRRAAQGEDIRVDAQRFVAGLDISPSGEKDARGNSIARVVLKRSTE
jgi:hypothetical protein